MNHCFSLIACLFFSISGYSQIAIYKIKVAGFTVGNQTVTQTEENDITTIKIYSTVKVSLGITYKVTYQQTAHYSKGQLTDSEVIIMKNDDVYNHSTTNWETDHYRVKHNDNLLKISEPIIYAGTRLYFEKPSSGESRLYSETECAFKTLQKINNNSYKAIDVHSGRVNEYFYKKGVLQKAVVHHTLINFVTELTSYTP